MFSRKASDLIRTLGFRITLWFSIFFVLSSIVTFHFYRHLLIREFDRRIDEELISDVREIENIQQNRGLEDVKYEITLEAEANGKDKVYLCLMDMKGNLIKESDRTEWRHFQISGTAMEKIRSGNDMVFETLASEHGRPELRVLYTGLGDSMIVLIAMSAEEKAAFLAIFKQIFEPVLAFVVLISALGGWFLANRSLGGLREITSAALTISQSGDLENRVAVDHSVVEIETLAVTFNGMLDRIQMLVEKIRETTDNMAHDLRNPITRIRGAAELMLSGNREINEYRAMAGNTIEECDRLLEMMNTMLDISEAESGSAEYPVEMIDLAGILMDIHELYEPLAEAGNIKFSSSQPEKCLIRGNVTAYQRIIVNLIENAFKYTPEGGAIGLSLSVDKTEKKEFACLRVSDTGIGIGSQDLPRIFEKFFRCQRSRTGPGAGLGLSLVKALVESQKGSVTVESTPDLGTTFYLRIPLA